jgi:hypothetical protein
MREIVWSTKTSIVYYVTLYRSHAQLGGVGLAIFADKFGCHHKKWVEARDAARYLTVCRTDLTLRHYPVQNANSIEKSCFTESVC